MPLALKHEHSEIWYNTEFRKKSSLWHISVSREKGISVVKATTMLTANDDWTFSEDGTGKLRSGLQEEST